MSETFGSFVCEMCRREFEATTPPEEALAESEKYFGKTPIEDLAVICNSCYQKIHPTKFPDLVAAARDEIKLKQMGVKSGTA